MRRPAGIVLFLAILSLFRPAVYAGSVFDELSSLDKDAYVHFSAGVLVSHVSYPLFKKYLHDKHTALWYSLGLTVLLAAGKELADRNTTGFSGSDLAAGVLGGCTILVVTFD